MKKILLACLMLVLVVTIPVLIYLQKDSLFNFMNKPDKTNSTTKKLNTAKVERPSNAQMQMILQQKLMTLQGARKPVQMMLSQDEKHQVITNAIEELKFAEHFEDRELAVLTLAAFPEQNTIQALITALDDPVPLVRQQAVMQMMYWPDEQQRNEFIFHALANDDTDVVGMTLEYVDENLIKDPRFHAKMVELSQSDIEEIREMASLRLAKPE